MTQAKKQKQPKGHRRSPFPITSALDILGDKWTLLVVRDLVLGLKTFSEIQQSPEGIPTHILADRLKRLEREGLIEKTPCQERPLRYSYHLTEKGDALRPVLKAMARWALRHVPGTKMARKKAGLGPRGTTGTTPACIVCTNTWSIRNLMLIGAWKL